MGGANKPQCIGFIMDGNRRWAKAHELSTLSGHQAGYEKLKEVVAWMQEVEIPHSIVYAFSTENWGRPKAEVEYLLDLMRRLLQEEEIAELTKNNARIIFAGDISQFPEDIREQIVVAEAQTAQNTHTIVVAASYGGRADIAQAAQRLATEGAKITEEAIGEMLWTRDVPEPDMIIRTGGEKRLSNFLTWQSVYSELFFTDTHWPDFSKAEFSAMLEEYGTRQRRYGK